MGIVKDKNNVTLQRGDKVQFFAEGGIRFIHKIKHFKRDGSLHLEQPPQYFINPSDCEKVSSNTSLRGLSISYRKRLGGCDA